MALVPAANGDTRSIHVDAVSRRVANIQTAKVKQVPFSRQIRAIGELHYDEGNRRTIAAYVDGRLKRMFADFTGVDVHAGDRLALLYAPELYSGQVAYLLARKQVVGAGRQATLCESLDSLGPLKAESTQIRQRDFCRQYCSQFQSSCEVVCDNVPSTDLV